jgi:glycerol uptake facilitator-like aquaporin
MTINYIRYLIEFFGTTIYTYVIVSTASYLAGNYLAVGSALALITLIGNGDFNPAVSFAMYFKGILTIKETIFIIISQILGGLFAVFLYDQNLVPV